jgi:hypothetical protein
VACGDTDISRETLASQPTDSAHPASASYPKAPVKDGKQLYYSMHHPNDQTTHQFIDKQGRLTFERPHVHVVFDEVNHEVRLNTTTAEGAHPAKIALPGDPSGNAVNEAIDSLREQL